ncbi:MAG: DEAD/DEAH box helicase [Pantoea sp.]|uniref:DEAD/DEAH box helicase n=1 Tax=Pantoea brenneri TaxID=472694 RepID=A0AAX3J2U1_9GAMM|nr:MULTISPECIES: SNF2-related protein [Pantoea]MBS6035732.1 DEAD/DEAH box helicase [Pantoea sp.]VXB34342.1 DEAD/DEAH box helicase [Pantoea brenneri]
MQITEYHAKYYAHELTCLHAADSVDRLSQSLFDATVDLNPHQIEAALFALRNPLQQGVLLADEVGLGKTIEAALVLCQHWAERRRRLVIVCPAALRKQWAQELAEKFALPSTVLDTAAIKSSGVSPRTYLANTSSKKVMIMSYHFAAKLADDLVSVPWDLVVIDEAHKLRNAHRASNRIGQALKLAFNGRRKVLLTATPLQNSLIELYGLSTLLDEHLFGDEKAFRKQFIHGESDTDELKQRLAGFAKRTLRSQVLEYVRYTKRQAVTQPFKPTDAEQDLYERISVFLQREISFALPKRQRHLTGLILRKLLASSPYAITGTLQTILERLQKKLMGDDLSDEDVATQLVEQDDLGNDYLDDADFFDAEMNESLAETMGEPSDSPDATIELQAEIAEIESFIQQAQSLTTDTKAEALLTALDLGFAKMAGHNGPRKAIIFTESKRTQQFLADYLSSHGYQDKIVTFSGTNTGPVTNQIYQRWLQQYQGSDRITSSAQVDKRTALIDEFREHAEIMIATEAAAEGVNLQFCALLINYDLPWNPQRVEQRIGRCHRYGQKHDVVVINFLNTRNQADQRVLELLTEKFKLFSGVFGASDEVLGRIESGIDFEKRIARIYDTCRKPQDIELAFEELQKELEADINDKLKQTQSQLMEHFDEDVHDKLKLQLDATQARLDKVSRWFWGVTCFVLSDKEGDKEIANKLGAKAQFDEHNYSFALIQSPIANAPAGRYQLVRVQQNQQRQQDFMAHAYRLNHPLGEWSLDTAKASATPVAELVFDYAGHETKLSVIADLLGKSGWLRLDKLTVSALDTVESLVFSAITDDGKSLDQEACEKLFSVQAKKTQCTANAELPVLLANNQQRRIEASLAQFIEENQCLFNAEREKLERWADDKLLASEEALKDTKAKIAQVKRDARKAPILEDQSELQNQLRDLERQQRRQRQQIFDVEDEIMAKRDELIEALQERLTQTTTTEHLFTIRWQVA